MSEHHFELDARRMLCPMPVIKTQDRIKTLAPGDRLKVICSDPGALIDIPCWCRIHGHEVISSDTTDRIITITIQVG
ncbi:MAG: sulfurtransferase TusA family protein [Proteobacteria bacterium]|nr:sulfurtransferase TusA family protein [Pseudomonadota bacterium]MCH8256980.1 sulfurtransferase TusA family protein [Pseudomonadota bacterium]